MKGARNYQELVNALGDEPLRTSDSDFIARLFSAWEDNLAVPPPFQLFNLGQPSEQLTVVEAVDADNLGGELGVLNTLGLDVDLAILQYIMYLTARSTISRISLLTSSRFWALRAGVRQMTLSTRLSSSSRPIPP